MVRSDQDEQNRDDIEVKFLLSITQYKSKADGGNPDHEDLPKHHHKVGDLVHEESAHNIGGNHGKSLF